jgi:hypothetical protein
MESACWLSQLARHVADGLSVWTGTPAASARHGSIAVRF